MITTCPGPNTNLVACSFGLACVLGAVGQAQRRVPTKPDPLTRYVAMLRDEDPRARWRAVRGLTALGETAIPVILSIIRATGERELDPPIADLAARSLARMEAAGVAAIPELIIIVKKGTRVQRLGAIHALGYIAPFDQERLPDVHTVIVKEIAVDSDARHSYQARLAAALARLDLDPNRVDDQTLIRNLHSRDATRRIQAAQWLSRRATPADRAKFAGELRKALRDRQPKNTACEYEYRNVDVDRVVETHREETVRQELARALETLNQPLPVVAWIALASHPDPAVRQESALALGGSNDAEAIPTLIDRLQDPDKIVAWEAITALGMLGPRAATARPSLEKLAEGPDKGSAARARAALRRIGGS